MQPPHWDRFWSKVEPTGVCWWWVAGKSSGGFITSTLTTDLDLRYVP